MRSRDFDCAPPDATSGIDVNMGRYVHHVPGRLRVRCKSLRGNPEKLEAIAEVVDEMAGVRGVLVNRKAGSITIMYDNDSVDASALLRLLDDQGCRVEMSAQGRTQTAGPQLGISSRMIGETVARTVVGTLVGAVVKTTLEPSVVSMLKVVRAVR